MMVVATPKEEGDAMPPGQTDGNDGQGRRLGRGRGG